MRTEEMNLDDFKKLDIKNHPGQRKYAGPFREFVKNDNQVLKYSFDTGREANSCYGTLRTAISKGGFKCKVIKRGTDVYVIKEA